MSIGAHEIYVSFLENFPEAWHHSALKSFPFRPRWKHFRMPKFGCPEHSRNSRANVSPWSISSSKRISVQEQTLEANRSKLIIGEWRIFKELVEPTGLIGGVWQYIYQQAQALIGANCGLFEGESFGSALFLAFFVAHVPLHHMRKAKLHKHYSAFLFRSSCWAQPRQCQTEKGVDCKKRIN